MDYSEFSSSDEHVPFEIDDDYLDEIHPEMTIEELEELEGMGDYLRYNDDSGDLFSELDSTIPESDDE